LEQGCIIVVEESEKDSGTKIEPETKGSGFKIVIVVIIVILLIGAGIFVYIYTLPGVTEVQMNLQPGEDHQIKLTCIVVTGNPEEYTGDGEITIEFEDGEQTYSSTVDIKESRGELLIWFNEFVIANGRYEITLEVEGKRTTIGYDVGIVVESIGRSTITPGATPEINIIMTDKDGNNLRFNYSQMQLKFGILCEYENEGTQGYLPYKEATSAINSYSFPFDRIGQYKRGNYTFDITFTNLIVKPDSDWYTIEYSLPWRLDESPTPYPGGPYDEYGVNGRTQIDFDASASKDDGIITRYEWRFERAGNQMHNHAESIGEIDFDGLYSLNLDPDELDDYTVTLIITDDNYPTPHNQSVTYSFTISRRT
jgi:hypothetical protein